MAPLVSSVCYYIKDCPKGAQFTEGGQYSLLNTVQEDITYVVNIVRGTKITSE